MIFLLQTAGDSLLINAILNGFPSVDSFFLISGVLLTYLTLKELEKTRGRISIPLFYIHRYLRLTGTYLIIIGFHATVLKYLCFGPKFKSLVEAGKGCQKGWWANLLYINNFGKYSGNGENFSDVRISLYTTTISTVYFYFSLMIGQVDCSFSKRKKVSTRLKKHQSLNASRTLFAYVQPQRAYRTNKSKPSKQKAQIAQGLH